MQTDQTKREWLAAKGLAKPGARGRFSLEAKAALEKARAEGIKFSDDDKPTPTPRVPKNVQRAMAEAPVIVRPPRKSVERARAESHGFVLAPRRSTDGAYISEPKVAVTTCASCNKGVGFCKGHGENNMPQAPSYLGGGDIFFE